MKQARPNLAAALTILESQGWFAQRAQAIRAKLGAIAKLRNFAKDELIYMAGDPPNGVFGLVSGSLNISFPRGDGQDYTLHRAGPGFWVGDLALFSNGPRLVSVRAAEPTLMVQLPGKDLGRLVREDPQLYADFYALTYENFLTAFRVMVNLAIPSTEKRVADRMLLEVDTRGDEEGWIALSQSELAKLVAISLPTLQRVMRRFIGAGLVTSSYARIQIVDRDGLVRLCRS